MKKEIITMPLNLDIAIHNWMEARWHWVRRDECTGAYGSERLDRFMDATYVLYSAFAEGWQGEEKTLVAAYEAFKRVLVEVSECDHLEVEFIHSNRAM